MNRTNIVIASSYHPDMQKDIDGLVCRIAVIGKRNPLVDRLGIVINAETIIIDFVGNSGEIWADNGREGLKEKSAMDYLKSFKEYERLWASRKKEGTTEKDWYKMQDELANW